VAIAMFIAAVVGLLGSNLLTIFLFIYLFIFLFIHYRCFVMVGSVHREE